MSAHFVDFLEHHYSRLEEIIGIFRRSESQDRPSLTFLDSQSALVANEIRRWKQDFLDDVIHHTNEIHPVAGLLDSAQSS